MAKSSHRCCLCCNGERQHRHSNPLSHSASKSGQPASMCPPLRRPRRTIFSIVRHPIVLSVLLLPTLVPNQNGMARALHVEIPSRRECLVRWTAATVASEAFSLTGTAAYADVLDSASTQEALVRLQRECADQALAVEQAVPGAYQQACMALPIRRVPIRVVHQATDSSDARATAAPVAAATPIRGQTIVDAVHILEIQQTYAGGKSSSGSGSLAGSTGTVVWNSSLLLTRLLERLAYLDSISLLYDTKTRQQQTSMLPPFHVMELGCGTALVSLAAGRLWQGATRVWATDGNPAVVQLAAANIERNQASDTVQAVHLPWGMLTAMDYSESADLVLGSDLTYFSGNWPALAETMSTVLKPNGLVLYLSLGHAGFNVQAELDGFLSVASGFGLVPHTAGTVWTEGALTTMLLNDCLTESEVRMIQNNGGVRVVALRHK